MSEVALRSLVRRTVGGGTPSRAVPEFWKAEIPWASVKDISTSGRNLRCTEEFISAAGLQASTANLVEPGTPIVAMRMAVGSVATFSNEVAINQDLRALLPSEGIDGTYLYYLVENSSERLSRLGVGSTVKGIRLEHLLALSVPTPPDQNEQRSIAELLTAVDEQIAYVELAVAKRTSVVEGVVFDAFGRLADAPRVPLANLAEVGSGVTLGRKFTGPGTVDYPYLRVANVQDGYLNLDEVKTIRLPESVAARAMLQRGDVLMNEGGDFDKLGRGAVWQGEVPNCLHQNHVFRVRCNQELLLPEFLALWAASEFGKKFFMLASKQSTNLASINSTQLKKFPVLRPEIEVQRKVLRLVGTVTAELKQDQRELAKLRKLKVGLAQALLS
ncbi:restriction endonuclease subunit S [Paucibacter sp. JuS9]|uniref:restriction endonuclease subunit S n=1 Tax=Paucibacter sp. JuS9 TaxID=3228748 RepID=UPI0037564541